MARSKKDPFTATRPKSAEVGIGQHTVTLRTATLDQESRFLEVIEGLDIHKLITPLTTVIQATQEKGEQNFLAVVAENGDAIWTAARDVLGKKLAMSLQAGSIALLDSEQMMEDLIKAEVYDRQEAEAEAGSDGEFLGCPQTRLFIKQNLTLAQSVDILAAAWTLNNYGELLGNILAPMTAVRN